MSGDKFLKGNPQAIEKFEKILTYRANIAMSYQCVRGFIWDSCYSDLYKYSLTYIEEEAKKVPKSALKFDTVNSYIQILPWVLLALNICRCLLILTSYK